MADVTLTQDGTDWWFENDYIKFRVRQTSTIDQIQNKSLSRGVMYFYPYFCYRDDAAVLHGAYLNAISNWILTSRGALSGTIVYLEATKSYTDDAGVVHNFFMRISLSSADHFAKINFVDNASERLNQMRLLLEANVYPQGYENQSANGRINVGQHVTYSVPLPYDNLVYTYTAAGTITSDTELETNQDIDAFIACYNDGDGDCCVVLFAAYEDLCTLRFKSLNYGDERQYMWLELCPRTIDEDLFSVDFYFGTQTLPLFLFPLAWYEDLPLVETLITCVEPDQMRNVRTDLNYFLYQYNKEFPAILDKLKVYSAVTPGNATVVPAGVTSWNFFKWRDYPERWNRVSRDLGEDFVQKSIDMCRKRNIALCVEIDILDNIWTAANPGDAAIGVDEVTPYQVDCPEDHSQEFPVSGGEINQPHQTLQQDALAGNNVVIHLPAGAFVQVDWEVGNIATIGEIGASEDVDVVGIDPDNNTITAEVLVGNYHTADAAYAMPKWFVTFDQGTTWYKDPSCGGDGKVEYWTKLPLLITPGENYHDRFIEFVTYLCENYNFYALVLSECMYKNVDYSAEAKALFLNDNPELEDWPRVGEDIDVFDETLGLWKTQKLGAFWDELKTIANTYNKKFFVMVEPNFAADSEYSYQAREFGHYYPEAIKHCDGLWLWGYYGNFDVDPETIKIPAQYINLLHDTYRTKKYIMSIGLWDAYPNEKEAITASELWKGLSYFKHLGSWWWIEITPSKLMTTAHWAKLWGGEI